MIKVYEIIDEPPPDRTPSRKREAPKDVESPARKRKKREQPSTPVRQVLVESVVERSPAVAVSDCM